MNLLISQLVFLVGVHRDYRQAPFVRLCVHRASLYAGVFANLPKAPMPLVAIIANT